MAEGSQQNLLITRGCDAQVGADLAMGSLIKSPGGTIVPGGGYIAGCADLVAAAAARLTAPGVGMDAGCVPGSTLRLMAQGGSVKRCTWFLGQVDWLVEDLPSAERQILLSLLPPYRKPRQLL